MESARMIDLTPTKKEYIRVLKFIISESPNKEDVDWCKTELEKAGIKNEK